MRLLISIFAHREVAPNRTKSRAPPHCNGPTSIRTGVPRRQPALRPGTPDGLSTRL